MNSAAPIKELSSILPPDRLLLGPAAIRVYECDAYTVEKSAPVAVCLPTTTEEVADIVRWCCRHSIPFTARGAGTGLSGGVLPALGGIVISTKKMNRILEIDLENRCLKAQCGVANQKISDAVASQSLYFAPDPSSQSVATLGGNIAENAGGPHTLKYGVTAQHVLSLTCVTVEGEIVQLGSRVLGHPGPDPVSLMVGAEGTLGIVTEAWVKLSVKPKVVATALISFPSIRSATTSVAEIIASGTIPAALEMMDRGIMNAVEMAFNLSYPVDAQALLLIECDSSEIDADRAVEDEMREVIAIAERQGALKIEIAESKEQRELLWKARKKSVGALGRLAPSLVTHDGVIPPSKLPEMLDFVYRVAADLNLGVANMFHAGDGNLHPCFYFDQRDPVQLANVVTAGERIIEKCIELGGSISGEHGIGVEKLDLMNLMFDEADLKLQSIAKDVFNDGSLCNPCKIIPNQRSCVEHKGRWKGVAW